VNKKYLEYAKKFPAERFICKDPPPPTKLKRASFEMKLQEAKPGDQFTIYSPGVSGWVRYTLERVQWPYVFSTGSSMPTHASHVMKLEKADGISYER